MSSGWFRTWNCVPDRVIRIENEAQDAGAKHAVEETLRSLVL